MPIGIIIDTNLFQTILMKNKLSRSPPPPTHTHFTQRKPVIFNCENRFSIVIYS